MTEQQLHDILFSFMRPQLDELTVRLALDPGNMDGPPKTRASTIWQLLKQKNDGLVRLQKVLGAMGIIPARGKAASGTRKGATAQRARRREKVVLILVADPPSGRDRLDIEEEVRLIKERVGRRGAKVRLRVELEVAVRAGSIRGYLEEHKPAVVHFCGHGTEDGCLIVRNDAGQSLALSVEALAELLGIVAGPTKCIVLNACYSGVAAEVLAQQVDYVVSMTDSIDDEAARFFAAGFYGALADGYDYATAYKLGRIEIELHNLPDADVVRLWPEGAAK